MTYKLKLLRKHFDQLQHILDSKFDEERACFLLCAIATTSKGKNLLARMVIPLDKNDLLEQSSNQLSIKPEVMLRTARLAKKYDLSICFIHTHPMQDGTVSFSIADDIGNQKSFEFFNRMIPDGINSALVWDRRISLVTGRVYKDSEYWNELENVEVVGEHCTIQTICSTTAKNSNKDLGQYDRQVLLLGKKGVDLLSDQSFAVIGAGGIGSIVSALLSHSGAGNIIQVDHDSISETNRPRVIYATPEDILKLSSKVDIAKNYAKRTNPDCNVQPKKMKVQESGLLADLVGVDAIICATDDHSSRAFLNQICQQYYIPLLDLGVQFIALPKDGSVVNEVGKINLVLPGTACLLCSNHIDPDRVRYEGLPMDQKEQYIKDGYIRGVQEDQPSMMMFNMEVASRGIQILLSHMLGIKLIPTDRYERFSFLGTGGAPHHNEVKKYQRDNCIYCGKSSIYLGMGDSAQLLFQTNSELEVSHA